MLSFGSAVLSLIAASVKNSKFLPYPSLPANESGNTVMVRVDMASPESLAIPEFDQGQNGMFT